MPHKAYFHRSWLSEADLWIGLQRSDSKENARYKLCKCVISLSNIGEKALRSHVNGKKHKKRLENHEQVKIFFQPKMQYTLPKNSMKLQSR